MIIALGASQDGRIKPVKDSVTVGDVNSTGMTGGVNAGMIGNLQQNYTLPTLVRGPLLDEFKKRFTEGARLYSRLQNPEQTDDQYKLLFVDTDIWINETYMWLTRSVSAWAAERFIFRMGGSFSWFLPGAHDPEVVQMR